ncbi:hypothetical protein [Acidiferrobacter sp.]|jgi:hypothetical protein|uniref:hypothetical protein n=1 Tax=Acidiferrobacter sp. TaxID=1872107 RepID=UPI0026305AAC|nr:hypothetical protein [Acidiferrobacter sp.]
MQMQAQETCAFDFYAEGPECIAVADWRASVRNAGCMASIEEVKHLISTAPACLGTHGTDADRAEHDLPVRAAEAGVPAIDL